MTLTACGGSPLPLRPSSRGPIALDHILISVRPGAPERAALERAGFTAGGFSSATHVLDSLGIVHFERGPEWLLALTLDNGRQGKTSDLRPDLPLVVKY